VVITYAIPVESSVPLQLVEPVAALEVLLEGDGAAVTGAGLSADAPVAMEGRTFQRYRASSVPAGAVVAVTSGMPGRTGRIALLVVAAMAVTLGVVLARRAPPPPVVTAVQPASEAIAREIAALDHVYTAPGPRGGDGKDYYHKRRSALLERLVAAQAVEDRHAAT
jgi:hypothetical protein